MFAQLKSVSERTVGNRAMEVWRVQLVGALPNFLGVFGNPWYFVVVSYCDLHMRAFG
jgi:hypothetical protein